MASDQVLVLDAGSSSIRCHLVDSRSRITRSASRSWTYLKEANAPELARAFDPDACWQSARDAIEECMAGLPTASRGISAVAVTSQRQSLAFLDSNFHVLYAGPNTDLRAIFEGFALDHSHGELIYSTTGHRPAFMAAPGKLAWFRDHRPDDYARIAHVVTLADWFTLKLTGNLACERTLASESGLLDLAHLGHASTMFETLELRCPTPPIHEPLSVRGVVSELDQGLSRDVPVVTSGADTQSALVGMGVVNPGSAGIVAGWSATVQTLVSAPTLSPDMKTWTGCFQRPRTWTVESNAGDMGNALNWLASTLFHDRPDPYGGIDESAQSTPLGSDGVSAYLGPQAMDVSALGMRTGGLTFPAPLTLGGPTRGQIARAALESFAYALRANVEQAESVAGFDADKIALGGGITRSASFTQIMTDVLGREVALSSSPDATAIGAALIAQTATGRFSSLEEAARDPELNNPILIPDPQNAAEYDDRYRAWTKTQRSLGQMPT